MSKKDFNQWERKNAGNIIGWTHDFEKQQITFSLSGNKQISFPEIPLKDKNGKQFEPGQWVNVPEMAGDNICEFAGTVIGFRNNLVQVRDSNDDVFECDPEKIEISEED